MNAEIVTIGTELLLGDIVNTNAAELAKSLSALGIDLFRQTSVGDNEGRLLDALRESLRRSDLVITTGGLGPTVDDITIAALSRLTGRRLIPSKTVLCRLRHYFRERKRRMPTDSMRQAYLPEGARFFTNERGTAPGIVLPYGKKTLIALPGPPRELVPMIESDLVPFLKRHFRLDERLYSRTIKMAAIPESTVNAAVKALLMSPPPTTMGIYAKYGEVHLKITTRAQDLTTAKKAISRFERIVTKRLAKHIFGHENETLEGAVGKILLAKRLTIAVAESCTGGLLAHRLTDTSGSSRYFMAGIVSYANRAKADIVGVRAETIERHGAVSAEVAGEMARGIRALALTDLGIGVTGIAGPTGGTRRKPVGLVYIGLVAAKNVKVREFRFSGTRQEIKFQSTQMALEMLRQHLLAHRT